MVDDSNKKSMLPPMSLAADELSSDAAGELRAERERLSAEFQAALDAKAIEGLAPIAQQLADVELSLGMPDEALASYRRAAKLLEQGDDSKVRAAVSYAIAEIERTKERYGEAYGSYVEAGRAFARAGDGGGHATCQMCAGDMCARTNRLADAAESYAGALESFRELDDPLGQALTLFRAAEAMADIDPATARQHLDEAKELFERVDEEITIDRDGRVANTPLPEPQRDLRRAEPWLMAKLCAQKLLELRHARPLDFSASSSPAANRKLLYGVAAAAVALLVYALVARPDAEARPSAALPEAVAAEPAEPVARAEQKRAALLLRRAKEIRESGDMEAARGAYERILEKSRAQDDAGSQAEALFALAEIKAAQADPVGARDLYEGASTQYARDGDLRGQANAASAISRIDEADGDPHRLVESYQRQVALLEALGESDEQARVLQKQLTIYWGTNPGEARDTLLQLLRLHERAIRTEDVATTLERLAAIDLQTEIHRSTRPRLERALTLYRENGDFDGQARVLIALGDVEMRGDNPPQARAAYRQALQLSGAAAATRNRALVQMAGAEESLGRTRRAVELLTEARAGCAAAGGSACSEIDTSLSRLGGASSRG